MLVIGLGESTSAICKEFQEDSMILKTNESEPELIEKNFDFTELSNRVQYEEGVLLFVDTSEPESALTLRAIEIINQKSMFSSKQQGGYCSVFLLRDKDKLVSKKEKLLDRIVFGVLQQKARSYGIHELILIDVGKLGSVVSEQVSLIDYEKTLVSQIVSTVQMYFQIQEKDPFYDSLSEAHAASKIMTLGYADFESGQETQLYDLKHPRDKRFFYLLTEEDMNTPGILKQIRTQIQAKKEKKVNLSFGVYKTPFDEKYVYFSLHSSFAYDEQEV